MRVYVIPRYFTIYCKEPVAVNVGREDMSTVQEGSTRMYSYSYKDGKLQSWTGIREGPYINSSLLNTTGGEK